MLINESSTTLDETSLNESYPQLGQYLQVRFPELQDVGNLEDEPHIIRWRFYHEQATMHGLFPILKEYFPCCRFPVEKNISQTEDYRAARLKGVMPPTKYTGLPLHSPSSLHLEIYQSVAGAIPILMTDNRLDFTYLVQAFAYKNEPIDIPASMGACMIAGFNNWDRIFEYRKKWEGENPTQRSEFAWQLEFKSILPHKSLYQDRFIILNDGFYSGVAPSDLGFSAEKWRKKSIQIRLEHECAHYLTKRVFGVMHAHLLDELIADYAGIVLAHGHFRADWFFKFMGMEAYPEYREGGRLQNYLGEISRHSDEFKRLQVHLKAAAENVESFDKQLSESDRDMRGRVCALLALCRFSLADLAKPNAFELLLDAFSCLKNEFGLMRENAKVFLT